MTVHRGQKERTTIMRPFLTELQDTLRSRGKESYGDRLTTETDLVYGGGDG
jgi:hypothetical protein